MEFSWNSNTKCAENFQYSISTHSFFDVPSFSKISQSKDWNQQIGKQCCLPPLSFKSSLRDTSFGWYILNSLGFFLSPECLLNFSDLYIPPCEGKFFLFMVFTLLENALNLCSFTHAPVPNSEFQVKFFENLFPPRRKGWRKLWFALLKFNQKIWRWLVTLVYLYFVWFVIFLNVMALQFCE